jgi:hydroxymethylbilane synthase
MPLDLPSPARPLRLGTRGSPLALAQAEEARARLAAAWDLPEDAFALVVIKVTGDQVQDRPLRALGGKGLFTREIEEALLAGVIDLAVHSMKDMPTEQPPGLVIDCVLPREDVRDAFVAPGHTRLADLPPGATVGSSSLRRRAQLARRRPDLALVEFRGNVQTRMRKLAEGVADATLLAMAGLKRLGLAEVARAPIEPDEMLPAIAQGAIGIERRAADTRAAALVEAIHDRDTGLRLACERAFLAALDGSCMTPIAGLADLDGGRIRMRGEILRPDGSEVLAEAGEAAAADGAALGRELGRRLRARAPAGFFAPA